MTAAKVIEEIKQLPPSQPAEVIQFKRFAGLIVCGEGELVKTFLVPGQIPIGQGVP